MSSHHSLFRALSLLFWAIGILAIIAGIILAWQALQTFSALRGSTNVIGANYYSALLAAVIAVIAGFAAIGAGQVLALVNDPHASLMVPPLRP